MNKELIYSMNTAFRGEYNIYGYSFGRGEKSACIVGSMRGNEYQQLYICAKLVNKLKQLEEKGAITSGHEILVIPSVNYNSMNIGKKYWVSDDSDLNREFPGNKEGQATSRIAAAIMERVKGYRYGMQFPSFYLKGEFVPHVRMMDTGRESTSLANLFGLPYVVTSTTRAFDRATLNYNWQMTGTEAFSIYSGCTQHTDEERANMAVSSVLRFLTRMGIIRYNCHGGYISTSLDENDLVSIKAAKSGFFNSKVMTNTEVSYGQVLAEIIDPNLGEVTAQITSPTDGIVFFRENAPMVFQNAVVYRIIKRIHV